MAAQDAASTLQDVVNSLDMNEVPNKLKCAICSKLALNAFKLPCCAQSICEICQSSLQGACPVCEHSPLSPDLCAPHKALRNTIKAYLKTAEKKLAEEQGKTHKVGIPARENGLVATPDILPSTTPEIKREESIDHTFDGSTVSPQGGEARAASVSVAPDDPQPSIETTQDEQSKFANGDQSAAPGVDVQNDEASRQWTNEPTLARQDSSRTESLVPEATKGSDIHIGQNGSDFGMNGNGMQNMMNMNMGMGGNMDFNPMMQLMPNGMMNGMPNMNNMMGMPGMGMDPMSQGMFGAFGQGMGMNQMNGMNMGFDPSGGQGMFGAWNNQNNAWHGQQGNHTNGFGNNMGFGYNMNHQGNFQQNQYSYNDFQPGYRGYGFRGRGGRGRGNYGWRGQGGYGSSMQGNHSNYQQQAYQQQQHQQQYNQSMQAVSSEGHSNGPVEDTALTEEERMKQMEIEFAPGDEEETNEALGTEAKDVADNMVQAPDANGDVPINHAVNESRSPNHGQTGDDKGDKDDMTQSIPVLSSEQEPAPIEVVTSENRAVVPPAQPKSFAMPPPSAPTGPAAHFGQGQPGFGFRGRGYGRFPTRGRGGFGFVNGPPLNAPTEPKGQGVIGAPTGPKALRKDIPPPAGPRGSTEGLQIMGRASMGTQQSPPKVDQAEPEQNHADNHRDRSRSLSQSASEAHSRHRSQRHRHHRGSHEGSDTERETRSRRDHHRRSSKYEDEIDDKVNGDLDKYSRASTPNSSRKESRRHREKDHQSSRHKHRSSHRSRHDYEDEMEESRDEGTETSHRRTRTSKHGSGLDDDGREHSHRSHRDREYDRARSPKHESRRHEDHHRDRKRSRREYDEDDDERGSESRHRSRRPKHDYVEGANGDRQSLPSSTPTEPEKDPHTLEREARNRERLLKEQQRRDAMNSERSGKSRRDSRQDRGHGGRRVSYKYEDETNAARVEREREAARWS